MNKFFFWVEYQITTGVIVSVEASSPAEAHAKLFRLSEDDQENEDRHAEQSALHEAFDGGEVQSAGISKAEFLEGEGSNFSTAYDIK